MTKGDFDGSLSVFVGVELDQHHDTTQEADRVGRIVPCLFQKRHAPNTGIRLAPLVIKLNGEGVVAVQNRACFVVDLAARGEELAAELRRVLIWVYDMVPNMQQLVHLVPDLGREVEKRLGRLGLHLEQGRRDVGWSR